MRTYYWGVFALVAGGFPFLLLCVGLFAGHSVLAIPSLAMLGSVAVFPLVAVIAWHRGDKRMISGGCALWTFPALISLLALIFAISLGAR